MKQGLILITGTVVGVKVYTAIHRYCTGMGERKNKVEPEDCPFSRVV